MFLRRSALALSRRSAISPIVTRNFNSSFIRRDGKTNKPSSQPKGPSAEPAKIEPSKAEAGVKASSSEVAQSMTPPEQAENTELQPSSSTGQLAESKGEGEQDFGLKRFEDIHTEADLLPPGAPVGTIPTDLNQSTGLERLEILGKMQGIDIFDMKPLDASRMGTLDNPIIVRSFGEEQYAGCTGYPADSHVVVWLVLSRERPVGRCIECGNVIKMDYIGPPVDHSHGHDPPRPHQAFLLEITSPSDSHQQVEKAMTHILRPHNMGEQQLSRKKPESIEAAQRCAELLSSDLMRKVVVSASADCMTDSSALAPALAPASANKSCTSTPAGSRLVEHLRGDGAAERGPAS
ncbi:MAG: Cytochrome c oxidase subunit 4 [Trizodia sp. TS-e1964]|nr:MAG: Cytochrome c oxidase subunit 4 [Trizodia sp. TS-e1964]